MMKSVDKSKSSPTRFGGFVATKVFCLGSGWVHLKSVLPQNGLTVSPPPKVFLTLNLCTQFSTPTSCFASQKSFSVKDQQTLHFPFLTLKILIHDTTFHFFKDPRFDGILRGLGLDKRGTRGEGTPAVGAVFDISNKGRLGKTEVL